MRKLSIKEQEELQGGFVIELILALIPVVLQIANLIASSVAKSKLENQANEAKQSQINAEQKNDRDTYFLSI